MSMIKKDEECSSYPGLAAQCIVGGAIYTSGARAVRCTLIVRQYFRRAHRSCVWEGRTFRFGLATQERMAVNPARDPKDMAEHWNSHVQTRN